MIVFKFEGQSCIVSPEAYKKKVIVLPDGIVITTGEWQKGSPLEHQRVLRHCKFLKPELIAEKMGGVLAMKGRRLIGPREVGVLQKGDPLFYCAGKDENRIEAFVKVVKEDNVGATAITIEITELVFTGSYVELPMQQFVHAAWHELYRLQ